VLEGIVIGPRRIDLRSRYPRKDSISLVGSLSPVDQEVLLDSQIGRLFWPPIRQECADGDRTRPCGAASADCRETAHSETCPPSCRARLTVGTRCRPRLRANWATRRLRADRATRRLCVCLCGSAIGDRLKQLPAPGASTAPPSQNEQDVRLGLTL
jgi:hypothetical protein